MRIWYLHMSSEMVEDLQYPELCSYYFTVYNSGQYFEDSGWQTSHDWSIKIGNDDDLCDLINPSNEAYGLFNWEFSIKVKDVNGNESPESVKLSIDPEAQELPDCYVEGIYTALRVCQADTLPEQDCDTSSGAYHLELDTQDGDYNSNDTIHILTSDIETLFPDLPCVVQYNNKCYYLPENYNYAKVDNPEKLVEGEIKILKLNSSGCYTPAPYPNPSCDCMNECWDADPSCYNIDEFLLDSSTFLHNDMLAHWYLNDRRDDDIVYENIHYINGTSNNNTDQMDQNPSDDISIHFNGTNDFIDFTLYGNDEWSYTSLYSPEDYPNPSYYEPENPSAIENPSVVSVDYYTQEELDALYGEDPSVPETFLYDHRFYDNKDMTYALWFKADDSSNGVIIADGKDTGFTLLWEDNSIKLISNADPSDLTVVNSLSSKQWIHVIITFDYNNPSHSGVIYVNNVEMTSFNNTFYTTDDNLMAGVGTGVIEFFKGFLADIRIYNKILNNTERSRIYNSGEITYETNFPDYDYEKSRCKGYEVLRDLDAYNTCLNDCNSNCHYTSSCYNFNPSDEANANPSDDWIYVYHTCEECWDVVNPETGWDCVNNPETAVEMTCLESIRTAGTNYGRMIPYTFQNVNNNDTTLPLIITNAADCSGVYNANDPALQSLLCKSFETLSFENVITIRLFAKNGTADVAVNGYTLDWQIRAQTTLGYDTYSYQFSPLALYNWAQKNNTYEMYGGVGQWNLPYITVKNQTPGMDWHMIIYCFCRSICSGEPETGNQPLAIPATLCDISDTPDTQLWILKNAIRTGDNIFKYNDICYSINKNDAGAIAANLLPATGITLLNYLTKEYDTCEECLAVSSSSSTSSSSQSSSSMSSMSSSSMSSSSSSNSSSSSSSSNSSSSSVTPSCLECSGSIPNIIEVTYSGVNWCSGEGPGTLNGTFELTYDQDYSDEIALGSNIEWACVWTNFDDDVFKILFIGKDTNGYYPPDNTYIYCSMGEDPEVSDIFLLEVTEGSYSWNRFDCNDKYTSGNNGFSIIHCDPYKGYGGSVSINWNP